MKDAHSSAEELASVAPAELGRLALGSNVDGRPSAAFAWCAHVPLAFPFRT